jgi:RNA polymerase sigma-70 factor (ECF subfamily)
MEISQENVRPAVGSPRLTLRLLMTDSDHDLMRQCREGHVAAFEALVRRWEGKVGRMLGGLLFHRGRASRCDIDDLAQEVFVRVLLAKDRYRPEAAFSTWLYQIVLNVARDAGRKNRRRPERLLSDQTSDGEASPATMTAQQELIEKINRAMDDLPDELREIVMMKHYGELTFAEIAVVTGDPPSTVKSRMQAALIQLRGLLKKQGIQSGD